ncbi:hypothetical protein J437_LFUL006543 [Ladona fulva]|uniref:Uncharacterized protein n=1 Tax=Ladona fulva TaxID=123851 RepID=A0A8K0KGV3_LADFU|nr:hypothetical protein J437_LFUL006543 [Ladona fulva]
MNLLSHLKKCGYNGTGTIRENRIPKDSPLLQKNELKKEERETSFTVLSKGEGIAITKWLYNSVIVVASTAYRVAPLMKIAQVYLTHYKTQLKSPGGQIRKASTSKTGATEELRNDRMEHFIGEIQNNNNTEDAAHMKNAKVMGERRREPGASSVIEKGTMQRHALPMQTAALSTRLRVPFKQVEPDPTPPSEAKADDKVVHMSQRHPITNNSTRILVKVITRRSNPQAERSRKRKTRDSAGRVEPRRVFPPRDKFESECRGF